MCKLYDLVELLEDNAECVVLKVKDNSRLKLICLGCFSGNETMFRITKGAYHTYTTFYDHQKPFSWELGINAFLPESAWKCAELIKKCVTTDFRIQIE